MNKAFTRLIFVVAILSSCQNKENKDNKNDISVITAISAERAKAFNDGKAADIAKHFTDDAFLMAPESVTKRGQKPLKPITKLFLMNMLQNWKAGMRK
jgi:ketosteroid isomerase-like protein